MAFVPANGAGEGSLRQRQIRAVETGNPLRRLLLVGSLVSERVRLFRRDRQRTIDIGVPLDSPGGGDHSSEGVAEGHVSTSGIVQGYLVLLFLVDLLGGLILSLAGLLAAYDTVRILGGLANPRIPDLLGRVPLLGEAMSRVANLFAWVPGLVAPAIGVLPDGISDSAAFGILPAGLGFLACWAVIRTLRASVLEGIRAVL